MSTRKILTVAAVILLPAGFTTLAHAGGPPGGTIYAHNEAYRTIGTPTNLPEHGDFNTIYALGGALANVSEAAPGDRDWRGGRWEVRPITWVKIGPTQYTNAEDIVAAAGRGDISIGNVVKRFECPLIKGH